MAQSQQSIWRAICSSRSQCHPQSPARARTHTHTHTHTPQGSRKHSLRTPGAVTPRSTAFPPPLPSTGARVSVPVSRWQFCKEHGLRTGVPAASETPHLCCPKHSGYSCCWGPRPAEGTHGLAKTERPPISCSSGSPAAGRGHF